MQDISTAGTILKDARARAGLSQRALARRAHTTQAVVARIEAGASEPAFSTLRRLLRAAGSDLAPAAPPADPVIDAYKPGVDQTLLVENLRRSLNQRGQTLASMAQLSTEFTRARRVAERGSAGPAATDYGALIAVLDKAGAEFIVVGGIAANAHGAARFTQDVDVVYARDAANLERLAKALKPLRPYLRGAPPGLPFEWSARTLKSGLNFALVTRKGSLDLLGEIVGGGTYDALRGHATRMRIFGRDVLVLNLDALIRAKRAAGCAKDFDAIAELELLRDLSRGGQVRERPAPKARRHR